MRILSHGTCYAFGARIIGYFYAFVELLYFIDRYPFVDDEELFSSNCFPPYTESNQLRPFKATEGTISAARFNYSFRGLVYSHVFPVFRIRREIARVE